MASAPSKTTVVKTVNNNTGITKSVSTVKSGGSTTVTKTTTIGKPKTVSTSSGSVSAPATAPGVVLANVRWLVGPNDTGWTMCGPVAVANHLLSVTGVEASNTEMERLYRTAGAIGDSGAPLEFFLAAACHTGLAGERLARYCPAERPEDAGVVLLGFGWLTGAHAAAVTPGGNVVLWGSEVDMADMDAHVMAAWSLTWHDTEDAGCRSYI